MWYELPTASLLYCIVQTLIFSRSYLDRQVSTPENLVVKGGTTWARNSRWILPENARLPRGTNGFTSLPKGGVLRIFLLPWKIPTVSAGFEPANLGTESQHATSRPPKPLAYCIVLLLFLWSVLWSKHANKNARCYQIVTKLAINVSFLFIRYREVSREKLWATINKTDITR